MIDLLDRYLRRLLDGAGAAAAVIWSRTGQESTGSVVFTRPAGLVAVAAPWPVTDATTSGEIHRDPAVVAGLVPVSLRLELPRSPRAASSMTLADADLVLLIIWYDDPPDAELDQDLRALIAEEISYAAGNLARKGSFARASQRLEAVIGELRQGVVSVDHSLDQVSVNPAAAQLLDLEPGEIRAAEFAAAMAALESRALNQADIAGMGRQLLADSDSDIECTWRFALNPTHVRVRSHAVRQGAYIGRVWFFEDVSIAAQALSASESAKSMLRASTDSMLDPQVLLEAVRDSEGRVVDFRYLSVNRAACDYLGFQESDLIGHTQLENSPNLEGTELQRRYFRCLEDGEPVILEDLAFFNEILQDSRRYDIQATRAGADLLTLTWRDVTERFHAARRIAESELQYRLIAENTADVVSHFRDDRFVWVSPSVEGILGAPAEYWLGRGVGEIIPTADTADHAARVKTLQAGGVFQGRARVKSLDGHVHWVHLHARPFYDAEGRRDGSTASFRLIDDEVAAEQQAEKARRQQAMAEARFRRSMDNAAIGMCVVTPDGALVEVNAAMCKLFGYDAETLVTKTWQELTAPEYLEADLKNVTDVLDGRIDSYRMLKQYIGADGRRIWGDLSVSCVRDDNGAVESFVSQIADVTASIEATQQYRLLAENAGDMVTHIRDGRFTWVSPSVKDLLGATPEYWVGREVSEIVPPDQFSVFVDGLATLADGNLFQRRVRVQSLDGAIHWVHAHAKPFYDAENRADGFTAAMRVIDAEVAAEQEAEEARRQQAAADARYRRSMDTAAVGMCLLSPAGLFLDVNPALCDIFGYDAGALRQKSWHDVTAPESLDAGEEERQALFAGRRDSYRVVKQYVHADGSRIWADVAVSCVRNDSGDVETLAAQIVDITAEVEAREKLARSDERNRALARSLQEQGDRLAAELESAAAYMASIMPRGLTGVVDVTSRYLPSRELGGDCFDYTWIDEDHLVVYLIDVSGHGIEPALLSVSVHNMLRSGSFGLATMLNPDAVLAELNELFQMEQQSEHYFTMWFGVYQASTRTLRYASGGAPPALAIDPAGDGLDSVTELVTPAGPVGVFEETVFTASSYVVPPGCRILIFSDGAYELVLDDGQLLSFDQFKELNSRLVTSSHSSLDGLIEELTALTPTGAFEDDCSLIQLTFD